MSIMSMNYVENNYFLCLGVKSEQNASTNIVFEGKNAMVVIAVLYLCYFITHTVQPFIKTKFLLKLSDILAKKFQKCSSAKSASLQS